MREFRQKCGRGEERYWQIWVEKDRIFTRWGGIKKDKSRREHGATDDSPGPKGKEKTKAWVSAEDNATFNYGRAIRKKTEEGYIEVGLDGRPLVGGEIQLPEIVHDRAFPKNLCFSKPKNSVKDDNLATWDKGAELIFTRKINGMCIPIHVMEDGSVKAYSRRMDDVSAKFPQLIYGIKQIEIPPKSVLLFEGFMGEGNTKKEFEAFQSIINSLDDRAVDIQDKSDWARFYLVRIPIWEGSLIEKNRTCEEQLDFMDSELTDRLLDCRGEYNQRIFKPIEILYGTSDEALALSAEYKYEGWVVYRRDKTMGDRSFSFTGKPDRPSCTFKLKGYQEDDFIAYWDPSGSYWRRCKKGCQYDSVDQHQRSKKEPKCPKCNGKMIGVGSKGTGKHEDGVGTLSLFQYCGNQIETYICEVGNGFSDELKSAIADPDLYPKVVQVRYNDRSYISQGDDSNALIFPRIGAMGIREDKLVGECINEELTLTDQP